MKTKPIGRVVKGLSVTSHQIRSRLKNRTLQKQNPEDSAYIRSEDLIAIQRMSKVEREMAQRKLAKEIEETQEKLDKAQSAKKAKLEEERIEKLANERFAQMRQNETSKKEQI